MPIISNIACPLSGHEAMKRFQKFFSDHICGSIEHENQGRWLVYDAYNDDYEIGDTADECMKALHLRRVARKHYCLIDLKLGKASGRDGGFLRSEGEQPVGRCYSQARKELLRRLHDIVSVCYNDYTQNYGPGGEYEGSGRTYRYPTTFVQGCDRLKAPHMPRDPDTSALLSGTFVFGANQVPIFKHLDDILKYLEQNHGLIIDRD